MSFDYPDKPKETKTPSMRATKLIYRVAWFGSWCLPLLLMSVLVPTHWAWHWLFLMGYLWNSVAGFLANSVCRRVGVSREESRQEIIERGAGAALAPFLNEAPVFDLGRAKRPRIRVDRASFSGYSSGSKWMRVAWKDVGSCIVTTRRDVFGNEFYCFIRLEGHEKFHTIFQMQLSQADAPQVLAAIRFYLRGEEAAPQGLGGDL